MFFEALHYAKSKHDREDFSDKLPKKNAFTS
jgi:hypothetical protein